ncbi:hypothetical protein AMJ57_00885 [Parcubacteria bacterium SG8_24]|nr:MAG: hypothetical protein AMJ57_00885 [Parcubacteria bacterium SG8_24]
MGEKKEEAKPLEKERVHVEVTPKKDGEGVDDSENQGYSKKVKKRLKDEVTKVIKEKKGDGAKKQLDAADEAIDEAKKKVSPQKVEKIRVKVEGESDGDQVVRERTVKPKGDG